MKKFFLLAAACVALSASAVDVYVIGANVNGKSWSLAEADAQMTDNGDGTYTWTGTKLGSEFKINDGTWNNDFINGDEGDMWNIGCDGTSVLELGVPFDVTTGGESKNIPMAVEMVANPKVVLDLNEMTVTVTGEEQEVVWEWYLKGSMNSWANEDTYKFVGEGDVLTLKNGYFEIPAEAEYAEFAIATPGWEKKFGTGEDQVTISAEAPSATLVEGGGNVFCTLSGTYNVEMNIATGAVVFTAANDAVLEIGEGEGKASYYTLQGVRVNAPVKGGVYVKVANGKAAKVFGK